jgi:integrase
VRGDAPGPLFLARVGPSSQDFRTQRLGHSGAYQLLTSLAERCGLAHFTPHDLRRTYAGDMLDCGVDLRTVQNLLGHSSVDTTAKYDRRGVRAKVDAAARLDARMKAAG